MRKQINNTTKTTILSTVFAMATMGAFANPVAFGSLEPSAVNPTVSGYNSIAVDGNTSVTSFCANILKRFSLVVQKNHCFQLSRVLPHDDA